MLPRKGKRINVAGFYTKTGKFIYQTQVNSFNHQDLILFFDHFCTSIDKRTIVVLDNAPTHRGKAFQAKRKEWQQQDLYLYFLPPYSPELNAIELLWRQIKYQWLYLKAFLNFDSLSFYLHQVLDNINTKYSIIFD
ncbi:transposase [Adhaeribacter radiodurans]|uniref:transposase n=1 Tax=Adhaeribacter radiodurans TaxID=2745197 RepID=UPI0021CF0BB1|nr:transposase [Adhaeribacter radiodurans]